MALPHTCVPEEATWSITPCYNMKDKEGRDNGALLNLANRDFHQVISWQQNALVHISGFASPR